MPCPGHAEYASDLASAAFEVLPDDALIDVGTCPPTSAHNTLPDLEAAGTARSLSTGSAARGSLDDTIGFLATLALFHEVDIREIEDVARMAQSFTCAPSQALFRQGSGSDGVYFIREGAVVVRARVPGDEAIALAQLGPGDVLGEVALFDRGPRTASAIAVEATTGYWLGSRHFDVLRLDCRPASMAITKRLIETTCASVRRSYARIAELFDEGALCDRAPATTTVGPSPLEVPAFPFASLPFFSHLSPRDLRDILGLGRALHATRGCILYKQGMPMQELFIVLRGAVRTVLHHGDARFQIAVHAPGSIVGVPAALDHQPSAASCEACETAQVLALDRTAMDALRAKPTPLSFHLSEHIHEALARMLRRCTDHISRLELERHLRATLPGGRNV